MLSRREWLILFSGLVGGLGLVGRGRATQAPPQKISKETAKYQDHPNDMKMCGMCKFYIPPGGRPGAGMMGDMMAGGHTGMMQPGTCQVVEGSIRPMGWCTLYQRTNAPSR